MGHHHLVARFNKIHNGAGGNLYRLGLLRQGIAQGIAAQGDHNSFHSAIFSFLSLAVPPASSRPGRAPGKARNWKWSTGWGTPFPFLHVTDNRYQNSLRFSPRASSARRAPTGSLTLLRKIMAAMI